VSESSSRHELRLALGAYVLGQLDEVEAAEVSRHVESCSQCRAELAELTPVALL